MRLHYLAFLFLAAAFCFCTSTGAASVTPQQRKDLAEIRKDIGEASKLVRDKKLDEATDVLDGIEKRLEALIGAGVPESEGAVNAVRENVASRRRAIALLRGEKPAETGISFSDEVAPLISENCLGCHDAKSPKGGLRLDTIGGWKNGGASRQPLTQVLMARLTSPDQRQRMPRGKQPLAADDLQKIARWMQGGAKFDGRSDDAPIGEKAEQEGPVRPKGEGTVSFVDDVAPFVVNICMRCHSGNEPRGGYDMTTYAGIMKGGESGKVIEPGNPDESRLWLMASNREQPRMPPGQLRLTRENYDALTTWIKEGAGFDGRDPKKPLRSLVPTAEEARAKGLAKLSAEEFVAHRRDRSDAQWKKAFPKVGADPVETADFLIYANGDPSRVTEVAAWADEQSAALRSTFGAKETPGWKGKLTVFLIKGRFDFEEFLLANDRQSRVPESVQGRAVVTPDFDEAYVVVEDVGDTPSGSSLGTKGTLARYLGQAYMARGGATVPGWVIQGAGLQIAADASPGSPYFAGLRAGVGEALKAVKKPEDLFAEGTFPPSEAAAVGHALVGYLIRSGGTAKYSQFVSRLMQGESSESALQAVYRVTPTALATAFIRTGATRR